MVGLRLEPPEDICLGVQRVAAAQLHEAIVLLDSLHDHATDPGSGDLEATIHRIRKRSKEVRGVLGLVRPGLGRQYRPIVSLVSDGARQLGALRDAQVQILTLDRVIEAGGITHSKKAARVRARQTKKADEALLALSGGNGPISAARTRFADAERLIGSWRIDADFDPVLDGLARTYRLGARRHGEASAWASDEGIHEWRKAVKQLWYQTRALEAAGPSVLSPLVASLDTLGELLGGDHDMAVLIASLQNEARKKRPKAALETARMQQVEMRTDALRLGATLYTERPRAFARRVRDYWDLSGRVGAEPSSFDRHVPGGSSTGSNLTG